MSFLGIDEPETFYRGDIKIEENGRVVAGHISFATPLQLEFLRQVSTIYVDGTFKCTRTPFKQLFTIHAFLRCKSNIKQVPLVSIFMTRRQKTDYDAVLNHLRQLLGDESKLETMVGDFEAAVWQSMKEIFPNVKLRGCHFHFTKAVFEKVKFFGLQSDYNDKDNHANVTSTVRRLFSLPFLPHATMAQVFTQISEESDQADDRIQRLLTYFNNAWFHSPIWSPRSFCVYHRLVRTNNDVEGYHNRLNRKCRKEHPPFYQLLEVLYKEASIVEITAKLVTNQDVRLHRKKRTKYVQQKICDLWDLYDQGHIEPMAFLEAIGRFMAFKPTDYGVTE